MIVFDKVTYKYHYEQFELFKQLSFTLKMVSTLYFVASRVAKVPFANFCATKLLHKVATSQFVAYNAMRKLITACCGYPKIPRFLRDVV